MNAEKINRMEEERRFIEIVRDKNKRKELLAVLDSIELREEFEKLLER